MNRKASKRNIPPDCNATCLTTGLPLPRAEAVGSYQWGLLLPSYRIDIPLDEEGTPAISERLSFQDKNGFEIYKAIHHEFSHYAQDVFTGLGCRTYQLDTHAMQSFFEAARYDTGELPSRETISLLSPICMTRSIADLEVRCRNPWFENGYVEKEFNTYSLLEADATSSVHELLARRLRAGDLETSAPWIRAMVEDELRNPRYPAVYMTTRDAFLEIMEIPGNYRHTHTSHYGNHLSALFALSRLFTDYAFSVPRFLEKGDRREHVPAYRYVEALNVLHVMTGEDIIQLLVSAIQDPATAFERLDEGCAYKISSWESNSAWEEWSSTVYQETGDRIALMRKKALSYKREHYPEYLHRDATWLLAAAGVPIFARVGASILEGWPRSRPDDRQIYVDRISEYASYMWSLLQIIGMTNLQSQVEKKVHQEFSPSIKAASDQDLQSITRKVEEMLLCQAGCLSSTSAQQSADYENALLAKNVVIAVISGLAAGTKIDWEGYTAITDSDLAQRVLTSMAGCTFMCNEASGEEARSAVTKMLVAAGLHEQDAEEIFETTLATLLEASIRE